MKTKVFRLFVILVMLTLSLAQGVSAAPTVDEEPPNLGANTDNPSHPKGEEMAARKAVALEAKMTGKAKGKTHEVAKGQYVELAREGEDTIWTILGQFGSSVSPTYGGTPGPIHNQIPQPDRSVDNSTIWAPDFNQPYYNNLLFSEAPGAVSMRNFYIEQSSNRHTVNGTRVMTPA